MLCVCKMIISPGAFLSFLKILIFRVISGVKGQKEEKKWSKMTKKNLPITLHISGTIHDMIVIYCTLVETNKLPDASFHFFSKF